MPRTGKQSVEDTSAELQQVSLQSLLVGDYVHLKQACEMLGGVDWHTLRGWIDALHIKTYAHPTDGRLVLLRSTDLEKLAKISDRQFTLPERPRKRKSSRAVLEAQLGELREQFERTVQDYESRLRTLQEQHQLEVEGLQQRIKELEKPASQ